MLCPDGISKHRIFYQWFVTAVSPPKHSDVKTGFRSTSCFFQECLHFEVQNSSLSFYVASVLFFLNAELLDLDLKWSLYYLHPKRMLCVLRKQSFSNPARQVI